jgi:hypothetical protein
MTNQHPITPPPDLVKMWANDSPIEFSAETWAYELFIAHEAARWGSDQELEACAEHLKRDLYFPDSTIELLRAARRSKPPSLKEQALHELGDAYDKGKIDDTTYETICRALLALPE